MTNLANSVESKLSGKFTPSASVLLAGAAAPWLCRRELPSIYPFCGAAKKCVAAGKGFGRGSCASCGPSELCYEALHSLPNGIRCKEVRLGDFVAGVPVEVDLDEQVELAVGK